MNWAEFFSMGGRGFYVWGSFGVTALIMAVEPIMVARNQKATIARLKRQLRAIQWTPEAYEPITRAEFEGAMEALSLVERVVVGSDDDALPPSVLGMAVATDVGGHRLSWTRPANKVGAFARPCNRHTTAISSKTRAVRYPTRKTLACGWR